MNEETPQKPKPEIKEDSFGKMDPGKNNGNENFLKTIKSHAKESAIIVLTVTALLLMLLTESTAFYGNAIIGLLIGIFFIKELTWVFKNSQKLFEEYGLLKSLVLGGALLALLIEAPAIIITVCAVMLFRIFLLPEG